VYRQSHRSQGHRKTIKEILPRHSSFVFVFGCGRRYGGSEFAKQAAFFNGINYKKQNKNILNNTTDRLKNA
jgi:hypothetical protein